ncbi:hypothetical protein E0H68_03420 [Rhizobium leguminosarum bv. viciae]|uniref:hypothetical protein n=1 Tax=Rhizobium leguminosarum TaxID=384 RepID=UPI00104077CB|nr:hypothetical protein [Rhizobium leguminosarum]TCA18499.1 hypothetical protein E0H68_03420 [Rhizobium leguminosarum bv. viciae]
MTTKAFPITVASLKPLACALSDRLGPDNEMMMLIRFCAVLGSLDPTHSAGSLYKELCTAIDARNVYRAEARAPGRFQRQLLKPTYGRFCRRLKLEGTWEASQPSWPVSFDLPAKTSRF